jgi:2-polyprenyl-3-methyl-5-hydroxy-6-metoxy-1,4-benzoquinol methylase
MVYAVGAKTRQLDSRSTDMDRSHYVIRGGVEGRERLRLLSSVMRPTTLALFERVGVRAGARCLDVGCGGGDVTFELARLAGAGGRAVGSDIDETKLELARAEAAEQGIANIEFRLSNASEEAGAAEFDVVYARFLLTHLADPAGALARMWQVLLPGGTLAVEDIDFTGSFCHPDNGAYRRYCELYTESVQRRGADPNIGPRLPLLLAEAGCESVGMNVVQPAAMEGDAKLVTPVTMENIADAVIAEGLADDREVGEIVDELYDFARNPRTVVSLPRVVQVWGYKPRE